MKNHYKKQVKKKSVHKMVYARKLGARLNENIKSGLCGHNNMYHHQAN